MPANYSEDPDYPASNRVEVDPSNNAILYDNSFFDSCEPGHVSAFFDEIEEICQRRRPGTHILYGDTEWNQNCRGRKTALMDSTQGLRHQSSRRGIPKSAMAVRFSVVYTPAAMSQSDTVVKIEFMVGTITNRDEVRVSHNLYTKYAVYLEVDKTTGLSYTTYHTWFRGLVENHLFNVQN